MTPWESLPNASEAAGVSSPPDASAVSASTRWLVREHLRAYRRANGSIRGLAPHSPVGLVTFGPNGFRPEIFTCCPVAAMSKSGQRNPSHPDRTAVAFLSAGVDHPPRFLARYTR